MFAAARPFLRLNAMSQLRTSERSGSLMAEYGRLRVRSGRKLMSQSRTAVASAILLALAGGLAACDDQPQRGEKKMESRERTIAEGPAPAPPRAEVPDVKPGAGPQSPPGAATLVGTWRLRVKSGAD